MRATRLAIPALVALVLTLVAPAVAQAEEYPVQYNFGPGFQQQLSDPDSPPSGANDWSCTPSAAHPEPVILVHGLFANQTVNWGTFSPLLANEGYCVFTLTYGLKDGVGTPIYQPGGLKPMEESAVELGAFVDKVLDATGAKKVDLLGHSQGTIMPSYYVRFLDGAAKVDDYVSLTPLWDGTTLLGLSTMYAIGKAYGFTMPFDSLLNPICESCTQFLTGSDFLKKLHAKGVFDPKVIYTNIITRYDQAVVPYTSGIGEGKNVTNHVLQEKCWQDFSDHAAVATDPNAARLVLNALDPANAEPLTCRLATPFGAP